MGPYQREGLLTSLIILTKKNSFQFVVFNNLLKWSIPLSSIFVLLLFFKEITQAYCQTKKEL